jgi:alanyl-tRNA synthetase
LKNPSDSNWRQYSVEFCGGTHLKNSGDVQAFVITAEESVSKGVRRIVALTGEAAASATSQSSQTLAAIDRARSLPEAELPPLLNALQKQLGSEGIPLAVKRRGQASIAELQAKYRAWEKAQQKSGGAAIDVASITAELLEKSETRGGGKIVIAAIDSANDEQLRAVIDSVKKRSPSFAAMVAASDGTKVSFVAAVSDDLIAKGLKAGDWIRETAKVAGGGGGGRPQMAQAGGKDPSKLSDALETAKKYAAQLISD